MVMLCALLLMSVPAWGAPARLQGYSRKQEWAESWEDVIGEDTAAINEAWENSKNSDEPEPPPYIDEDGRDARYGVAVGEDKYRLAPIYSLQKLYDIKSGKVADPSASDGGEDDEEDDEEEFEDEDEDEEEEE